MDPFTHSGILVIIPILIASCLAGVWMGVKMLLRGMKSERARSVGTDSSDPIGAGAKQCRNPRCQHVNRSDAQYCAICGRWLA